MLAAAALCAVAAGFAIAMTAMNLVIDRSLEGRERNERQVEDMPQPETRISISALGDMLAHDSIVTQAATPNGYDFSGYFNAITPIYQDADIVFCNPETPVAGQELGISGYPSFNAPQEFAQDLIDAKCNMINLATNHIYDKGQSGIDVSRRVWQDAGPRWIHGANSTIEDQQVSYATVDGVVVAFVAFADFSNVADVSAGSLNMYRDTQLVNQLMAQARERADVVIVSAHWGEEGSNAVSQDQRDTAARFVERGADIVIGTGPHVLQPVEWVEAGNQKGLVWFSIGNMLSSQLQVNELTGIIAQMDLVKNSSEESFRVENIRAFPTFMSYQWSAQDRSVERLESRSNFQLRPMRDASTDITEMFSTETYESRLDYVTKSLGPIVTLQEYAAPTQ